MRLFLCLALVLTLTGCSLTSGLLTGAGAIVGGLSKSKNFVRLYDLFVATQPRLLSEGDDAGKVTFKAKITGGQTFEMYCPIEMAPKCLKARPGMVLDKITGGNILVYNGTRESMMAAEELGISREEAQVRGLIPERGPSAPRPAIMLTSINFGKEQIGPPAQ